MTLVILNSHPVGLVEIKSIPSWFEVAGSMEEEVFNGEGWFDIPLTSEQTSGALRSSSGPQV